MSPLPNSSKLLSDILQRASTDALFRRRLLSEPDAAIREAFGVQVPPGFRLRFIERGSDADAVVVLPDPGEEEGRQGPEEADDELTDDELDDVAGGRGGRRHVTWEL